MIKKLLITMMVTTAMMILMSGCQKTQEPVNSQEGNNTADHADHGDNNANKSQPKEITLCENFEFDGGFYTIFTPGSSVNMGMAYYLNNFYETLVKYENGEITPGLAESWSISDDGLVYTFQLVEGVTFSDGEIFNSHVVKKNLEMIPGLLGEYNGSFGLLTTLIKEIEIISDYTVKVHLQSPYYGALQDFTKYMPLGMVSPNAFNEDGTLSDQLLTHTLGTGPYMYDGQKNGKLYTFKRNPYYDRKQPDIDAFHIKVIPDNESMNLALRNGEIDIIFGWSKLTYDTMKHLSDEKQYMTKVSDDNIFTRFLGFNLSQAPFDDKRVREAIHHAMDKSTLSHNLFYGYETVADTFFSTSLPYCDVTVKPYDYDLDKAMALLEESGWKDSNGDGIREKDGQLLSGEILYKTGEGSADELVLALTSFFKALGMDMQVAGMDMIGWYARVQKQDFTMVYRQTYGIPYDPYTTIANMNSNIGIDYSLEQGLAHLQDGNGKIEELTQMVDRNKIQEKYDVILHELHENNAFIPLTNMKELVVFDTDKIVDYTFDGNPSNLNVSGIKLQ